MNATPEWNDPGMDRLREAVDSAILGPGADEDAHVPLSRPLEVLRRRRDALMILRPEVEGTFKNKRLPRDARGNAAAHMAAIDYAKNILDEIEGEILLRAPRIKSDTTEPGGTEV